MPMPSNQDLLDKLQRQDHDALIRVETKLDRLMVDVNELKDGTTQKLTSLEIRVKSLEKLAVESEPEKNIKRIEDLYEWMLTAKVSVKWLIITASIVASIISFIVSFALRIYFHI